MATGLLPTRVHSVNALSARRGTIYERERILRFVKWILSKLTLEKFELQQDQVLHAGINSADILQGVTSLIFDMAVLKPTFTPLYSELCVSLDNFLPEFSSDEPDGKPITFRGILLHICQEKFEGDHVMRAEICQLRIPEQKLERQEKEILVKLRTLGHIRLVEELLKQNMIPEKIVRDCMQVQAPTSTEGFAEPDVHDWQGSAPNCFRLPEERGGEQLRVDCNKGEQGHDPSSLDISLFQQEVLDIQYTSGQQGHLYLQQQEPSPPAFAANLPQSSPTVQATNLLSAGKGAISDEVKVLRFVKWILSKLTPAKFAGQLKLVLKAGINSADLLHGVTQLIFDNAVLEPTFCPVSTELYLRLGNALPEFPSDKIDGKCIKFIHILLNMCQQVFEGSDALQMQIQQLMKPEQELEHQEKMRLLKLKSLGIIRVIGILFKQRILPTRIVHRVINVICGIDPQDTHMQTLRKVGGKKDVVCNPHHPTSCILLMCHQGLLFFCKKLSLWQCIGLDQQKLLSSDDTGPPAEMNVEAVCQLLTIVGKQFRDCLGSKGAMELYFARLKDLSDSPHFLSCIKCLVHNTVELQQTDEHGIVWGLQEEKVKGKTSNDLFAEAEQKLKSHLTMATLHTRRGGVGAMGVRMSNDSIVQRLGGRIPRMPLPRGADVLGGSTLKRDNTFLRAAYGQKTLASGWNTASEWASGWNTASEWLVPAPNIAPGEQQVQKLGLHSEKSNKSEGSHSQQI